MDTHRIEVLHVADGDAGVADVAHHLVFDLLPSEQRTLDQHLADWAGGNAGRGDRAELFQGERRAAAGPAESEGRTDNERQANLRCERFGVSSRFLKSSRSSAVRIDSMGVPRICTW